MAIDQPNMDSLHCDLVITDFWNIDKANQHSSLKQNIGRKEMDIEGGCTDEIFW